MSVFIPIFRSNVESTDSSLKRVFAEELGCEKFGGQVNELLCKLIAYSLRTVGMQMRMRGVTPTFLEVVPLLGAVVREMVGEKAA